MFLWIGPLFLWIGPRVSQNRTFSPPDIWNTHGISGNVFVNPLASSSPRHPGGFNPGISNVTEDTSPHVTSESQNPDTTLDPRCQSGFKIEVCTCSQFPTKAMLLITEVKDG